MPDTDMSQYNTSVSERIMRNMFAKLCIPS